MTLRVLRSFLKPLRLALLAAATFLCSTAGAQVVYDHFDSPALDDMLWLDNHAVSSWQTGSELHLSAATGQGTSLPSQQQLRGDLEVVMDWRGYQAGASGGNLTLQVQEPNQVSFYYMMREDGSFGSRIGFYAVGNPGGGGPFTVSTGATAGLFRIVRSGSQISGYYDIGAGWVLLGTYTSAYIGDAGFQMGIWNLPHVAMDYVLYSGTPIYAIPDIQINGSDGPLTVAAGTTLDITIALEANLFAGQPGREFVVALRQAGVPIWCRGPGSWVPSASPSSTQTSAG